MSTKDVVFITGANTGLGYEAVKSLLQSDKAYHIFLGSRSLPKGEAAVESLVNTLEHDHSTIEAIQIDVTDDDSIQKAFQIVQSKFEHVDVLINNAGAAFDTTFEVDGPNFREIFNKAYDVNVSGAQVVTYVFAPLLIKSSSPRLLFLTSGMATLVRATGPGRAIKSEAGWPKKSLFVAQGYRSSKTALNMVMLAWHMIFKEDNVRTWSISPGALATNLGGDKKRLEERGAGDPATGGRLIRQVVEGERDADVGKVVSQNGAIQDW